VQLVQPAGEFWHKRHGERKGIKVASDPDAHLLTIDTFENDLLQEGTLTTTIDRTSYVQAENGQEQERL
jgi:hypothetical protein